ncbi:MAG TPA: PIN domain nuclease [Acidimicrobiales bacterium]|nr:PIN domain nuclease [Acidimicrobiales bacterium]
MARTRYLADTSVFARLTKPAVAAAFSPLAAEGLVALSAPVAFELGYAARSPSDFRALSDRLGSFPPVPTTDADHRRALDVQAALADRSQHRALSLVDALVAAAAEVRGLVVLHYDADFELLAEITGQPHQWVVARGTAD